MNKSKLQKVRLKVTEELLSKGHRIDDVNKLLDRFLAEEERKFKRSREFREEKTRLQSPDSLSNRVKARVRARAR